VFGFPGVPSLVMTPLLRSAVGRTGVPCVSVPSSPAVPRQDARLCSGSLGRWAAMVGRDPLLRSAVGRAGVPCASVPWVSRPGLLAMVSVGDRAGRRLLLTGAYLRETLSRGHGGTSRRKGPRSLPSSRRIRCRGLDPPTGSGEGCLNCLLYRRSSGSRQVASSSYRVPLTGLVRRTAKS